MLSDNVAPEKINYLILQWKESDMSGLSLALGSSVKFSSFVNEIFKVWS